MLGSHKHNNRATLIKRKTEIFFRFHFRNQQRENPKSRENVSLAIVFCEDGIQKSHAVGCTLCSQKVMSGIPCLFEVEKGLGVNLRGPGQGVMVEEQSARSKGVGFPPSETRERKFSPKFF